MDVEQLLNDIDSVLSNDEITPNSERITDTQQSNLNHSKHQALFSPSITLVENPSKVESSKLFEEMDAFLKDPILLYDDDEEPQINAISNSNTKYTKDTKSGICNELKLFSMNNRNDYCEQIRCLKCDHIVVLFNEYKWHDVIDYLFFRLNFPDRIKLKKKLIKDKNYCCYCCQCQCININLSTKYQNSSTKLRTILRQWQCCGHISSNKLI